MKANLIPIKLAMIELRKAIKEGDSLLTITEKFLVLESQIEGFEKELQDMLKENGDPKIQRYTADMLLEEILGE